MSNEELILSTIKKVYAIREAVEKRADQKTILSDIPVIGDIPQALAGTALSRDQLRDISAFITATCTSGEKLNTMEAISSFKTKSRVKRSLRVWLSYIGFLLPILIVIFAEAYLIYQGLITNTVYVIISLGLVIVALLFGILIFAVLGYDPEYRRESVEHSLWKIINAECNKRLKQGVNTMKQLPPAPPESEERAEAPAQKPAVTQRPPVMPPRIPVGTQAVTQKIPVTQMTYPRQSPAQKPQEEQKKP